ncbi:MAG: hypothetical protein GC192_10860 [Bacteroidetes bacterium]|nr:hypothetical protein [Bacteroidota bacterium]
MKENLEGYPLYPPSEDIYKQSHKEADISPDNFATKQNPNVKPSAPNEKDFRDDVSGSDLDVPGSELDDQMEQIGSEDEENNYYSIGGDNHDDLEEDNS